MDLPGHCRRLYLPVWDHAGGCTYLAVPEAVFSPQEAVFSPQEAIFRSQEGILGSQE